MFDILGGLILVRRAAPIKKPKTKPRSKQPKKVKFISKYVCLRVVPPICDPRNQRQKRKEVFGEKLSLNMVQSFVVE
jgi:hypothetical protein